MPPVLRVDGFRFFFYSNENRERPHIHVEKSGGEGKIWLSPLIAVEYMTGLTRQNQGQILSLVRQNYVTLLKAWNEHFGN